MGARHIHRLCRFTQRTPGAEMVAIVSGMRSGLQLNSGEVLGFRDVIGGPLQGRNGQDVAVNVAQGQLVVQDLDDLLAGRGEDAPVLRTYDPSEIEGDKTPSLATPKPKKKKGSALGKLLMAIVAIVATVFTAGLLSGAAFAEIMSVGAGVVAGTAATLTGAAATLGIGGTLALSAAVGSIAGQLVGMVTGDIDKFDWKGVALSALSAGIGSALPAVTEFNAYVNVAVRAAGVSAVAQGISVVTGL